MVRGVLTGICQQCGAPCSHEAKRCKNCFSKRGRKFPHCIDCGKVISNKRKKRCFPCYKINRKAHPEESPRWKGGRFIGAGGYPYVRCPTHPRATKDGYIREHIIIWEQAHGTKIPDGWVIHHLNGIKTDNRPINLVALSDKRHSRVFNAKAKRIQELEALINNQHQLI